MSTQQALGRIMRAISRKGGELADRIVTASPDVTSTTNLTGWVNQRGVYGTVDERDTFLDEEIKSVQRRAKSPGDQHFELGIAESNLFLLLAELGLSHELFGYRILPVGVLYDVFISRGLDQLNYACYQDARFLLVGTPSGITLCSEGGAHQSIYTPLIGMGQDRLTYFEPTYADELAAIMEWGFHHLQQPDGGRCTCAYRRDRCRSPTAI